MGLLLDVIEHVGQHDIQKMFRFMHKQDVKTINVTCILNYY